MSDFNPYREWLGIKSTGSVSYYQLLGVRREDSNERIREQATRLVRMLKQIDAGEHETEKRQLIDRVRRAAKRLMDPALRKANDKGLAKQARTEKPRAAPKRKSARRSEATEEESTEANQPAAVEPASEPASEQQIEFAEPIGGADSQLDFNEAGRAPETDPDADLDSDSNLDFVEDSDDIDSRLDFVEADTSVRPETEKTVTDELLRMRPRKRNIAPAYKAAQQRSRAVTLSLLLAATSVLGIGYLMLTQTQFGKQWLSAVWPADSSVVKTTSANSTARESDDVPPLHDDQIDADSAVTLRSTNASPTPPQSKVIDAIDPIPALAITELPEAPELLSALQQAKRLLGERKADEAKQVLVDAREFATHPTWRARLARMTTLASYVASYWGAAQKQLATFRAGNEAMIGNTPVMIVERSEQKLIVRNAGRNQTIDLTSLSQSLAMKLADGWLDEDAPSTKVFRGAMMAVTLGQDATECLTLWREAEASGELKLHDLTLVLDELKEY